jgi:hypothetical protein
MNEFHYRNFKFQNQFKQLLLTKTTIITERLLNKACFSEHFTFNIFGQHFHNPITWSN